MNFIQFSPFLYTFSDFSFLSINSIPGKQTSNPDSNFIECKIKSKLKNTPFLPKRKEKKGKILREIKERIKQVAFYLQEKGKMALKTGMMLCCKVFISESRNGMALDSIERASKHDPDAVIVNKFEDRVYNRVRYTLVSYVMRDVTAGTIYTPLRQTLLAMAEAAYSAVDLGTHCGAHPRIGVVDQICFHPLAEATLEDAAMAAKLVASDMGNQLQGISIYASLQY